MLSDGLRTLGYVKTIRSAMASVFAQIAQRFAARELPAPSHRTLLDPASTLLAGDLALVGAAREDQTEWVLCTIALDCAPRRSVLVVSQDQQWLKAQMVSMMTGISIDKIGAGTLTGEEAERLRDAKRLLDQEPIVFSDSIVHGGQTDVIADWMGTHTGGLVLLPAAWPASLGSDEDEAAAFVREMKAIARGSDGSIVIPWRTNSHRRSDQRPSLRDLAVSGAAEDDADQVLLVHEWEDGVEVFLAKNRHGTTGYIFEPEHLPSVY